MAPFNEVQRTKLFLTTLTGIKYSMYMNLHFTHTILVSISILAMENGLKAQSETPNDLAKSGRLQCIKFMREHCDAFYKTGIGRYYGYQEYRYETAAYMQQFVLDNKKPGTSPIQPIPTTCIGHVVNRILPQAYKAIDQEARWNEIIRRVKRHARNGMDTNGVPLMKELARDGWHIIFYVADSNKPFENFLPADHVKYYLKQASKVNGEFLGIPINGVLKDFYLNSNPPVAKPNNLSKLKNVPFWVGIGYRETHVFCGRTGSLSEGDPLNNDNSQRIIIHESHQSGSPDSKYPLEEHDFIDWISRGYEFGAIAIPNGYWSN